MQTNYRNQIELISWSNYLLVLPGIVMALLAATSMTLALLKESRYRAQEAEARNREATLKMEQVQQQKETAKQINDHNQAAILMLMNELQEVASGDLTVQATVSEGITGAIADSVNYTLEELRVLMGRVISTADQIVAAANQAGEASDMLLSSVGQQSREIQKVCETVNKSGMAVEQGAQINHGVDSLQSVADNIQDIVSIVLQKQDGLEQTTQLIHEVSRLAQELGNALARFQLTM